MKDRTNVQYWNNLYREADLPAAKVNLHERSHQKRLATVKHLLGLNADSRVLDIGCGIGLLREWCGPFSHYVGIDFCRSFVDHIKADGTTAIHASVFELKSIEIPEYNVAVMLAVTSIPGLFGSLTHLFDTLLAVKAPILVSFMWSGYDGFTADTQTYSVEEVYTEVRRRKMKGSIHFGHLPHEFFLRIDGCDGCD